MLNVCSQNVDMCACTLLIRSNAIEVCCCTVAINVILEEENKYWRLGNQSGIFFVSC